MNCKQCGHEISGNVKFCNQCGALIDRNSPTPVPQAPITDSTGSNQHLFSNKNTDAGNTNNSDMNTSPIQKKRITWKFQYILVAIATMLLLSVGTSLFVRYVKGMKSDETIGKLPQEGIIQDLHALGPSEPGELISTEIPTSKEGSEGEKGPVVVSDNESENTLDTNIPNETKAENVAQELDFEEDKIHQYSYHIDDCTWSEAFLKAKEMGGYLVRINTREEYTYILAEIMQQGYLKKQFLIGGRRDAVDFNYYWVEENNFYYGYPINSIDNWANSEWLQGEPSFNDGDIKEEFLVLYFSSKEQRWGFNDVPDAIIEVEPKFSGLIGYIVEYGSK